MTDDTAAATAEIIERLAIGASGPREVQPGKLYIVHDRDGEAQTIDLTGDAYLPYPQRKRAHRVMADPLSFLHYWDKHHTAASDIYAHRDSLSILGVLDAHSADRADWETHTVKLQLALSRQIEIWIRQNEAMMKQADFAEFVVNNRADIVSPDAATLLEIAETFTAARQVTFRSAVRNKDGQRQLTWIENTETSAGARGDLAIPDGLTLALPVFAGADLADEVSARLRYRIDGTGGLTIGYVLDQVQAVVDAAFAGVVSAIDEHVDVDVMMGQPHLVTNPPR